MCDNTASRTSAPALEKGLDIIELLADSSEPLVLSAIARRLDRKVSEIQRMVKTLEGRGYLFRESQGGYFLSSKLFRLAHLYSPFRRLSEIARPHLEHFSEKTGESVHLSVLSENKGLILDQSQGRSLARISVQLGALVSLSDTVSGCILLSDKTDAERKACIQRAGEKGPSSELLRDIARIRSRGHLYRLSATYAGLHDLGLPVKLKNGSVLAAITATWVKSRRNPTSPRSLLPPLRHCAASIEARLDQ